MLATVEFNNQAAVDTHEIRNVRSDRKLAPKLSAIQLAVSQGMPQAVLRTIPGFAECLSARRQP